MASVHASFAAGWMCCGRRPSSFCALIHHAIWRGGKLAVVQLQLLHHALDQAQLVVGVEHLEAFRQLRVLPVQAQQAVRQAVEGADPHAARAAAQLRVDAARASRRRPCW